MMHTPTISLVMIHRRAGSKLLEAVGLALDHVDEVVLVDTGPDDADEAAVAARHHIVQSIGPECAARGIRFVPAVYCGEEFEFDGRRYTADFAAARNRAHSLATSDWEFFLDADDLLAWDGDWNLRKLVAEVHAQHLGVGEISMPYRYQPGILQDRVRLWRRRAGWEWRGALHEERHPLAPGRFTRCQLTAAEGFQVEHRGDSEASAARNAALLMHCANKGVPFTAQMTIAAMAGSLDAKDPCAVLILKLPEDASRDAHGLFRALRAEAYRRLGRDSAMLAELGAAVALAPHDRSHWAELGLEWADLASDSAKPSAALALKHAYLDLEETWAYLSPVGWFEGEAREKAARFMAELQEFGVASHIAAGNDAVWHRCAAEIKAQEHRAAERVKRAMRRGLKKKPVERPMNRIDFLVPSPVEGWGPTSSKVVGGSERAVLEVVPRLAALGLKVHVWALGLAEATPGHVNNATWHDLADFDPAEPRGALVVWRDSRRIPGCKGFGHPVWLWAHDIPEVFGAEGLHAADKVFALSRYHYNRFYGLGVEADRLVCAANGLNHDEIVQVRERLARGAPHREGRRAVYCSAANRGLLLLLDAWLQVRAAVPDATLEVCYGLEMFERRDTPPRLQGLAELVRRRCHELGLHGVTFRGATPHDELLELLGTSGVWAYPCVFEEISCIAAMEAQAMGAWPVTTDMAALQETVRGGAVVDYATFSGEVRLTAEERALGEVWTAGHPVSQRYVRALVSAMLEPPSDEARANLSESVLSIYDWSNVAAHFARALEMEKKENGRIREGESRS